MNFLNYKRLQQIKTAQKKVLIQCFKKIKLFSKKLVLIKLMKKL